MAKPFSCHSKHERRRLCTMYIYTLYNTALPVFSYTHTYITQRSFPKETAFTHDYLQFLLNDRILKSLENNFGYPYPYRVSIHGGME